MGASRPAVSAMLRALPRKVKRLSEDEQLEALERKLDEAEQAVFDALKSEDQGERLAAARIVLRLNAARVRGF